MRTWKATWRTKALIVVCMLALTAGVAYAATSGSGGGFTARNVGGTVSLPDPETDYYGRFHLQHPGVDIWAVHFGFVDIKQTGPSPLGGPTETFGSTLELQLRGDGVNRNIPVSADCEVFAGPINKGAKVQVFNTEMNRIEATLTGDPDFEYFHLVGGSANGYPSPGSTTITDQGDGTSFVQSSFDIGYRIEFRGAPGGRFAGQGGTFEGRVTMTAYPSGADGTGG